MLKQLFSFKGKIGRLNYFLLNLFLAPLFILSVSFISNIEMLEYNFENGFLIALSLLYCFLHVWAVLSLFVKRFHDFGVNPNSILAIVYIIIYERSITYFVTQNTKESSIIGIILFLVIFLILCFRKGTENSLSEQ